VSSFLTAHQHIIGYSMPQMVDRWTATEQVRMNKINKYSSKILSQLPSARALYT